MFLHTTTRNKTILDTTSSVLNRLGCICVSNTKSYSFRPNISTLCTKLYWHLFWDGVAITRSLGQSILPIWTNVLWKTDCSRGVLPPCPPLNLSTIVLPRTCTTPPLRTRIDLPPFVRLGFSTEFLTDNYPCYFAANLLHNVKKELWDVNKDLFLSHTICCFTYHISWMCPWEPPSLELKISNRSGAPPSLRWCRLLLVKSVFHPFLLHVLSCTACCCGPSNYNYYHYI